MRRKFTPFAIDVNDDLYVLASSLMHPLVLVCDGLSVTFFGKERKAYLKIDDAIEWCDRERKTSSKPEEYRIMAAVLREVKEKAAIGQLRENV